MPPGEQVYDLHVELADCEHGHALAYMQAERSWQTMADALLGDAFSSYGDKVKPIPVMTHDHPTKVMFDFVCKAVGGELATSDETTDCRWVPKEKVLDFITLPAIRLRFEAFLDYNGSVNYIDYITATTTECEVKLQRRV